MTDVKDVTTKTGTLFLKLSLLILGAPILLLCIWILPNLIIQTSTDPSKWLYRIGILAMYTSAIPYFYTLFQAQKLLKAIDSEQAFSVPSIRSLSNIKISATSISVIYLCTLPISYLLLSQSELILVLNFAFVFMPLLVGVFAAVLQKLLAQAFALKEENEYTI